MGQIGLKAYRLSISWPRVIPEGTGATNPAGLDFYDRLVDALLKEGVTPLVTLFHWTIPRRSSAVGDGSTRIARIGSRTTPTGWYLYWSILDNYEWERGYTERFGLILCGLPDPEAYFEGFSNLV